MYELTVVIPTFNERDNIRPLIAAITEALQGVKWELVFVDDDSVDGTLDLLHALAREHLHIRFIHRIDQRGLASACIEGMLSSVSPFVAVMDADLQHDEMILPVMLHELKGQQADLVIGSRHVDGGSMGTMPKHRVVVSQVASQLSHLLLRHHVTDPMSGFFMMRQPVIQSVAHQLSAAGYKLLLDIIVSAGSIKVIEIPYDMRHRQFGESKLDTWVVLEYLHFLLEKTLGKYIPVKFMLFVLVGLSGVAVNLAVLGVLYRILNVDFFLSQSVALVTAMTSNFVLNNLITHRESRLHGMAAIKGLVKFYLACALGGGINLMVADFSKDHVSWWIAGTLGAAVGAVWNYGITSIYTWKRKKT